MPFFAAAVLLAPTAAGAQVTGTAGLAGHARPASVLADRAGQEVKVPVGFEAASASFVSTAWGVVLGGVGCTPSRVCPARLAATADSGARWHLVTAPDVWISEPAVASSRPQVSQVVLASRRDGWLYR